MRFPKLTPLQSRLVASLGASIVLLVIWITLTSPNFAYALDLDSIQPEDHNHVRLARPYIDERDSDDLESASGLYEPGFFGIDRAIIGRQAATAAPSALTNNVPTVINVTPGSTQYFVFTNTSLQSTPNGPSTALPSSSIPLRRSEEEPLDYEQLKGHYLEVRQTSTSTTLYITANTCLQPTNPNDPSGVNGTASQLQLWVSTDSSNQNPGPASTSTDQLMQPFVNGFANYTVDASSDVYISVYAPNTTLFTSGVYSLQIAGSIDQPYHNYINNSDPAPNLYLIDSDSASALLVTNNLTQISNTSDPTYEAWMALDPAPFDVFVFNSNNTAINGLTNSYCALEKLSGAQGLITEKSMTNITGSGNLPKEQFHVTGLNGSSHYYGIVALGNSTKTSTDAVIGGGGTVWEAMQFSTQSDGACSVIYNLSFCSTVAYAVPGNFKNVNFTSASALASWYDSQAETSWGFFQNVLAQIPCEIESSGQYSLTKTCTDCELAYKAWLCSVLIPRCEDYTSSASWLQARNIIQPFPNGSSLPSSITEPAQSVLYLNSSRNPLIDTEIQPGPYKEILPCEDLCYDLVKSCPASMGFGCPTPGMQGFDVSYGLRPNENQTGLITCNYPGAVYGLSGAMPAPSMQWYAIVVAGMVGLLMI